MRYILLIIASLALSACDNSKYDRIVKLENEVIELTGTLEKYDLILKNLNQEIIAYGEEAEDFDKEFEAEQKKIDEQDARYESLLGRWEEQANRMDKVLAAQEKALIKKQ